MKLIDFWPTQKHVDECIRPEAENPAEAVFLAVHRPMRFLKRALRGVNVESSQGEQDLLDAFLEVPPRGTLLLPILGDSGTGKSHMIRWLDVQLRRQIDAASRHIILIPKSSSLKRVLHLILESLHGARYQEIREQLRSARERLDVIAASNSLRANLLTVIRRRATLAKQKISQARQRGVQIEQRDRMWEAHGDERCLPALLSDPITSQLFMLRPGGTVGIIDEIAQHLANEADVDGPRRAQFTRDDFRVPDVLDTKAASEPAKKYLAKIVFHDGTFADQAIDLLNEIIDEAIAPLTNPGDTGLTELFVEIRKQLKDDGRELVLLVEDFAALAGIQGSLFDAMNVEGEYHGDKVACVMRTALAVTSGYISRWDTVSSRAIFGWELENVPHETDEHTVAAITDLVGAYLNAARIGQSRLQELFNARDPKVAIWSPRFDTNDDLDEVHQPLLQAFGNSNQGTPLFPFNRQAIQQIAGKRLRTPDGRIRFNPRDVINHIVRPVLLDYRSEFEHGQFPPARFLNFNINEVDAALRQRIAEQHPGRGLVERYSAVVRFWGNDARDLRDVRLPNGVFDAFGLKPLVHGSATPPPRPGTDTKGKQKGKDDPPPPPEPVAASPGEPKEVQEWITTLDKWSQGTPIGHNEANRLRKLITEGVAVRIDWDRELFKPIDLRHDLVFIPRARGGPATADKALVTLCNEESLDDPDQLLKVILSLRAVIRFDHYKTWNFRDSANDFAYYANFMERASQEATAYIRQRYASIDGDCVPALAQSLVFGSRVLNIDGAHNTTDASLVAAVFAEQTPLQTTDNTNWDKLRSTCSQTRPQVRDLLLRQVAARQGGADKVHAVDAARLLDAIRQFKREGRVVAEFPGERLTDTNDESVRRHVGELRRDGTVEWIGERRRELTTWKDRALTWLGADFDKELIAKTLLDTLQEIQRLGLYPNNVVTRETLKVYVEAFRVSALRECLGHIDRLKECNDLGTILSAVAQADDATRSVFDNLMSNYDLFLKTARQNVQTQLKVAGADLVDEGVRDVTSIFEKFTSLSRSLTGGDQP